MNENQFWVFVWKVLGACFCVVVLTTAGCTVNRDRLITQSADPIAASCAISGGSTMIQVCEVARVRK